MKKKTVIGKVILTIALLIAMVTFTSCTSADSVPSVPVNASDDIIESVRKDVTTATVSFQDAFTMTGDAIDSFDNLNNSEKYSMAMNIQHLYTVSEADYCVAIDACGEYNNLKDLKSNLEEVYMITVYGMVGEYTREDCDTYIRTLRGMILDSIDAITGSLEYVNPVE